MMKTNQKGLTPCVVVNANNTMAFAVIRSLGKRGVPIIAALAKTKKSKNIFYLIKVSQYIKQKFYFHEDSYQKNLLKCLLDIHKKLKLKAVLIPVDDDAMFMISKHRDRLKSCYHFIMPDHTTIETLLDKYKFYPYAERNKLSVPKTYLPKSQKDIPAIVNKIRYPCLIKPPWRQKEWYDHFGSQKVLVLQTPGALRNRSREVFQFQKSFVIQEEISGEDKNILCSFTILDRHSNPLCLFICRKTRQYPPYKGDTSMAESCWDSEISILTVDICKKLHLIGYISIEFKKDLRDNAYKIIEITPARINRQAGLSAVSGIDIPWYWYQTVKNNPIRPRMKFDNSVGWISEANELRSVPSYLKNRDITFLQLIRSYQQVRGFEVFDKSDLLPFLIFLNQIGLQISESILSMFLKIISHPFRKVRG